MIRVDIETIIMAAGPVPSVVVLRERNASTTASEAPLRALSIQTGSFEINRVDAPLFFASVVLGRGGEDTEGAAEDEVTLDARPSDALALAVRANAPIYVEDDVMNRAGSISFSPNRESDESELERFDRFVQTLSPDDF